ncbi:MAG: pilus assembly protein [Stenotrophomonas sp.]|uniref:pilus assembly protein n=1 Tax=Stenotrophomonas sp. TaxID=69392 RepID=UPI003D6CBB31
MASRKFKWTAAGSAVAVIGLGLVGYNLIAAQGQGTLAQEPLATKVNSTPAFIMAVDDSGSMNFQTQFPGMDGEGCWNTTRQSFFDANGQLYTAGNCDYFFVLPGPRINSYYGVPPLDSLGFARSSAYNPTYYDPTVKYDPWMQSGTQEMAQSDPTKARIDPKPTGAATTVNLVSDYYSTAADDSFRMQNGMVVQANTTIRNNANGNTTTFNTQGTWNGGIITASIQYRPATFYVPYTNDGDAYPQLMGTTGVYDNVARLKVANACGTGCTMWKYTISNAGNNSAAANNFANWFTYYGNRNRAMIAGMTRSMAPVTELRVGYFRINQNTSYDSGTATNKRLTMRDMGTPADKAALYTDMLALTASGGTPNRQAVNAAALQFTRTDSPGAPIADSCQKNAVMLFTDGFSNGGGPSVGNTDQGMGAPFSDGNSDTMADIVSRFYVNNGGNPPLRPDLPAGKVPVPAACDAGTDKTLDCQTNLHINFYGVTLGARGNLFNPDLKQNPYTDAAIYGNWPPRQDDQRSTVDDIWHAAVNTRGEYINARTPVDITNAMSRVLSAVGSVGAPASGTGASGARIGAGSLAVASRYDIKSEGTDWASTLSANRLSVDATTRAVVETKYWEASAEMQAAASRRIFFTKAGTTREFTAGNVTLDDLCTKPSQYAGMSLCTAADLTTFTGANAATAVSYLRGDVGREKRNGGTMRDRTTRLGDIINSTPVAASPIDDYGYRRLGGTLASSYASFLTNKAANGTYMVYVGANDGMLHGFNGGLNAAGGTVAGGGTEAFAYIPSTALGHMGNMLYPYDPTSKTGQKFKHKYYVDGQITVGDTNYGGAWHTTLVGSSGAGGRSVFGLDVTAGTAFTAASKLWEISDLDTNLPAAVRANIGFVLGKPVIVPVLNSAGVASWKAIFGNGFNSASGKAVLFVVDIGTGAATMIEAVETGTGVPSGSNGLSSIVVVDRWGGTGQNVRTRDGYSDTVYGTDQKGAVWKFDLRSSGNIATPLFTTRPYTDGGLTLRQPITGGITAGNGSNGGVMLYFGTGSFVFTEDPKDSSLQSLYGVNDVTAGPISTTLTRNNLTGYSAAISNTRRMLTTTSAPANARGWYIDLAYRERFVGTPSLSNGIVYMPTYVPRDQATSGSTDCAVPGDNWLFGLQPLTGAGALGRATLGSPTGTAFDVGTAGFKSSSKDGSPITNANAFALPRPTPPALGSGPGAPAGPPTVPENVCVGPVKFGAEILYVPYACGRQSWRQIQ